jgi:hypothetical protein
VCRRARHHRLLFQSWRRENEIRAVIQLGQDRNSRTAMGTGKGFVAMAGVVGRFALPTRSMGAGSRTTAAPASSRRGVGRRREPVLGWARASPILTPSIPKGNRRSFDSLKGPRGLVLIFSRSADWCPYCKTQLADVNRSFRVSSGGVWMSRP